jgi:hypothetical protein
VSEISPEFVRLRAEARGRRTSPSSSSIIT